MSADPSSPIPAALTQLAHTDPRQLHQAEAPHLLAYLATIPDPRAVGGRRHRLVTILGLAAAAVLAGARSIAAIAECQSPLTGLLVDYHLDRGNGIAAIRDIRRRFGNDIPAILITADRSPHVRAAAREENVAVLNKPVKPASLRALLGQWRTQQVLAAE